MNNNVQGAQRVQTVKRSRLHHGDAVAADVPIVNVRPVSKIIPIARKRRSRKKEKKKQKKPNDQRINNNPKIASTWWLLRSARHMQQSTASGALRQ
jgi:hypothetical protein